MPAKRIRCPELLSARMTLQKSIESPA